MSLALFFLLFLQFGVVFFFHSDTTHGLKWTTVNLSIGLFILATYLYRNALTDIGTASEWPMLFPDIIIVTVIGLVFFYQIIPAFLLLVAGKCAMAFTVVAIHGYQLWHLDDKQETSPKELSSEIFIV